jgi:hypothetical protein
MAMGGGFGRARRVGAAGLAYCLPRKLAPSRLRIRSRRIVTRNVKKQTQWGVMYNPLHSPLLSPSRRTFPHRPDALG